MVTWNYSVAAARSNIWPRRDQGRDLHHSTLDDGNGGSRPTITVTITGTNDAPIVAATDVTGAVTELVTPVGNLTDTGTIAFTDVDLTDVHSVDRGHALGGGAGQPDGERQPPTPPAAAWAAWSPGTTAWRPARSISGRGPDQGRDVHLRPASTATAASVTRHRHVTITGHQRCADRGATDVTGAVTELVTPAGNLTDTGTIAFTDVDLTDVHSVSAVTPSAGALGTLTASVTTDTTGSGLGGVVTWNYSVAAGGGRISGRGPDQGRERSLQRARRPRRERDRDRQRHHHRAPTMRRSWRATDVTGAVTELVTPVGNLDGYRHDRLYRRRPDRRPQRRPRSRLRRARWAA